MRVSKRTAADQAGSAFAESGAANAEPRLRQATWPGPAPGAQSAVQSVSEEQPTGDVQL